MIAQKSTLRKSEARTTVKAERFFGNEDSSGATRREEEKLKRGEERVSIRGLNNARQMRTVF